MIPSSLQERITNIKQECDAERSRKTSHQQRELEKQLQQAKHEFAEILNTTFDAEIQPELQIEIVASNQGTLEQPRILTYAGFFLPDELGKNLPIKLTYQGSWQLDYPDLTNLEIDRRSDFNYYNRLNLTPSLTSNLSPDRMLLLFLDNWQATVVEMHLKREQLQREEEELEARRQAERERILAKAAARERKEAEESERHLRKRQEQARQIALEDARIQQQIEVELAAAKSQIWQWQAGMQVTLYHWVWCAGGAVAADGSIEVEYDSLWSDRDVVGAGGYLVGYADSRQYFPNNTSRLLATVKREIKLIPQIHKPVVQKHVFDSLESLPDCLKTLKFHTTKGVELYGNYHWEILSLLEGDEDDTWYRENPYKNETYPIGMEPLDWVKEAIGL